VAVLNMWAHASDESPGKLVAAAIAWDSSSNARAGSVCICRRFTLGKSQVCESQLYVLSHCSAAGLIVVLQIS
jgi:hypothetical protein